MIKERIPISGDLGSKVKQLMEYAGWYEGRSVDISIAEQYYADHGIPMMKTTQDVYKRQSTPRERTIPTGTPGWAIPA